MKKSLSVAVLLASVSVPVLAQTTLSFSGVLPFDSRGLGTVQTEGSWQWQRDPWAAGTSVALTSQGWDNAKLDLSYEAWSVQASASASFGPQRLKSAWTQLQVELTGLISLQNALSFAAKGFQSGTVKCKVGSNALNATTSAKLMPTGFAEPVGALNFSASLTEGDVGGTTTFNTQGLREQSLSATGYILGDWTLTMNSALTLKGLKSQSFELGTTLWWDWWNLTLSFGVTLESQGITSGTVSADIMLDQLFVQTSLDFAGLELSSLQVMANGSWGSFVLDGLVIAGSDGIEFAQVSVGGSLIGFDISGNFDISGFGLDQASLNLSRTLDSWTVSMNADFRFDGFQNGSLQLSRSWKFP